MTNRIEKRFTQLKKEKRKALVTFITAGDPSPKICENILNELPRHGVDMIEIGIPFSDPMADGPTIQRSSQRAISSGSNLKKTFEIIRKFRTKNNEIPIVLMGYFNPIFQFSLKSFFIKCKSIGIDGVIIVDLPPEENDLINQYTLKYNVHNIRLITPTTDSSRLKKVLKHTSGFLYYVSVAGVTGTKKPLISGVKKAISKIKKNTKLPVLVGFGIDSYQQIQNLNKVADGCVIGSAIIKIIEENLNKKSDPKKISGNIRKFLLKLKRG